MTRNRKSAKAAGTRFETEIARYLAATVDDRIERRTKGGRTDRGDIGGVRLSPALGGGRVVLECKDTTRTDLAGWHAEAHLEAGNDDAVLGAVVHKRRGVTNPGDQWVHMTLADLAALLTGHRPEED